MTNCPCRVARGVWSFIVGSLRMLLFFAAILLILLTAINSLLLYQQPFYYLNESSNQRIQVFGLASLVIALLAAFGSFFEHRPLLKMFAFLAGLQAFVIVVIIFWGSSSGYFDYENKTFLEKLGDEQAKYDWSDVPTKEGPNRKVTMAWDLLQSGKCCGINGPDDWNKYRPSGQPKNAYPRSCCKGFQFFTPGQEVNKFKCEAGDSLRMNGCREGLTQNMRAVGYYFITFSIFQLLLAGVACCISSNARARSEEERQRMAQLNIVPMDQKQTIYPPLHYGSV